MLPGHYMKQSMDILSYSYIILDFRLYRRDICIWKQNDNQFNLNKKYVDYTQCELSHCYRFSHILFLLHLVSETFRLLYADSPNIYILNADAFNICLCFSPIIETDISTFQNWFSKSYFKTYHSLHKIIYIRQWTPDPVDLSLFIGWQTGKYHQLQYKPSFFMELLGNII